MLSGVFGFGRNYAMGLPYGPGPYAGQGGSVYGFDPRTRTVPYPGHGETKIKTLKNRTQKRTHTVHEIGFGTRPYGLGYDYNTGHADLELRPGHSRRLSWPVRIEERMVMFKVKEWHCQTLFYAQSFNRNTNTVAKADIY